MLEDDRTAVLPESFRGFLVHLEPRDMATFVRRDYEILSSRFSMRRWFFRGRLRAIPDRVAIYLGVLGSDFNISWFGYKQAYWAVKYSKHLGRKSIVVLGGFDVCEEEDPRLSDRLPLVRYILRNADCLLAVSERVRTKAMRIDPGTPVSLIYHGFDAGKYRPERKKPIVTTVAFVREGNLQRKGLQIFVKAAALLPNLQFHLVGEWMDHSILQLKNIAPSNVVFDGYLSDRDLITLLGQTSVYVQASLHETFGCSMAEAMLCSCVPVVSDRGAIPEVVGETGIYVDPSDVADVSRGIQQAMISPNRGTAARERISSHFPLERRRRLLLNAVADLFQ